MFRNHKRIRTYFTVFVIALVILSIIFLAWQKITKDNQAVKEAELAKLLNVNLENFPRETNFPFPYSYFETKLNSFMNISDVHKLIVGYEKVLHCPGSIEVYYYYSANEADALRFKISYDENFNFQQSYLEDDNSRTISVKDCASGLIQP